VAYITAGDTFSNAFAFYSYAKNRMLFDSEVVFIGHINGGEIYGEYDNNDGTKLLRPDLYLELNSKYLGLWLFVSIFNFIKAVQQELLGYNNWEISSKHKELTFA